MFFAKFWYAISTIDLNVLGLISGVIGSVLVTWFGLPSLAVLSEASYIEVPPTPKTRTYNRFSRTGLVLIVLGFVLQLLPAVYAIKVP